MDVDRGKDASIISREHFCEAHCVVVVVGVAVVAAAAVRMWW